MDTQQGQQLLTVDEVIRVLRLGRTRVNEMLRSGDLPLLKIGRRRLVRAQDVERFLEAHEYRTGGE